MKRAKPTGEGRRCAFCHEIGGTGFNAALIEELGGERGNRYAHSDCFAKAQKRLKGAERSPIGR